jgi:hypothetical protein
VEIACSLTIGFPIYFLSFMFYVIEQPMQSESVVEELEIIIDGDTAIFSWNNEMIEDMAEELGETEFPQPRPCG